MKHVIGILLIVLIVNRIDAQDVSGQITVGEVLRVLTSMPHTERAKLSYKSFKRFDFAKFLPATEKADSADYTQVGYDRNGNVREIIRRTKGQRLLNYMFVVYDVSRFKILLLKEKDDGAWRFTSRAIVITGRAGNYRHYMIDVMPRMGDDAPALAFSYDEFPEAKQDNISAVTMLDDNLYPRREVKFLNNRIVMASDFIYRHDNPHVLQSESVSFYFSQEKYKNLNLTSEKSLEQVTNEEQLPEYQLSIRPDLHELNIEPLWILQGRHLYVR